MQRAYVVGYRRAHALCRAELKEMATRFDEELASLQDDLRMLRIACLYEFHQQTERDPNALAN
jgi:hypothetical protein